MYKPEEDRATLIEMLEVDTQLFMGNARHHAQAADAMCKLYYKWNAEATPKAPTLRGPGLLACRICSQAGCTFYGRHPPELAKNAHFGHLRDISEQNSKKVH